MFHQIPLTSPISFLFSTQCVAPLSWSRIACVAPCCTARAILCRRGASAACRPSRSSKPRKFHMKGPWLPVLTGYFYGIIHLYWVFLSVNIGNFFGLSYTNGDFSVYYYILITGKGPVTVGMSDANASEIATCCVSIIPMTMGYSRSNLVFMGGYKLTYTVPGPHIVGMSVKLSLSLMVQELCHIGIHTLWYFVT